MAKSTATSASGDLKKLEQLLALLRQSGVRRYKAADLELELDPPAPALSTDSDDEADEIFGVTTRGKRGKKGAAVEAPPKRRRTVMDEADLYPDGEVPELDS